MKKILMFIFFILLLSGCDASKMDTMSCDKEYDTNNGIDTKITYSIDYENNEVKKVRMTYDYTQNDNVDNVTDGVGTGTDGTTNDTSNDKDGIIDGVIGDTIDNIINGVTGTILDLAGLKSRHDVVKSTYGNVKGFSLQDTTDVNNNYKVTYVVDFDEISNDDLTKFNLDRDFTTLKTSYIDQGFTCK